MAMAWYSSTLCLFVSFKIWYMQLGMWCICWYLVYVDEKWILKTRNCCSPFATHILSISTSTRHHRSLERGGCQWDLPVDIFVCLEVMVCHLDPRFWGPSKECIFSMTFHIRLPSFYNQTWSLGPLIWRPIPSNGAKIPRGWRPNVTLFLKYHVIPQFNSNSLSILYTLFQACPHHSIPPKTWEARTHPRSQLYRLYSYTTHLPAPAMRTPIQRRKVILI